MPASRPKNQHVVPRFYLEHFTGSEPLGQVWTYDIMEARAFSRVPAETAVMANAYSVISDDGEYNDALEHWLSAVEGKAALIYPKVLRGETLKGQERADFSTFIASLYSRGPGNIRNAAEVIGSVTQLQMDVMAATQDRFDKAIDESAKPGDERLSDDEKKAVRSFFRDPSNYELGISRQAALMALSVSDELQELFYRMKWYVLEPDSQHLITCDNPVTKESPKSETHPIYGDGGFLNRKAIVSLPISSRRCLVMGHDLEEAEGVMQCSKNFAKACNRGRAVYADRFLYAAKLDHGIVRLGEKYKNFGLTMSSGGRQAKVRVERNLKK